MCLCLSVFAFVYVLLHYVDVCLGMNKCCNIECLYAYECMYVMHCVGSYRLHLLNGYYMCDGYQGSFKKM